MRGQATVSLLVVVAVGSGLLVAAAFTDTASFAEAQTVEINRFTIDAGGDMLSDGGGFQLSGTVGQPDAGVLSGGGLTLAGGFWFGQSPGDSNEDGGINLLDCVELNACASGPGGGLVAPSCACFDMDGDQDVDLEDIGTFQRLFSGY
jgi:hypothetical protein